MYPESLERTVVRAALIATTSFVATTAINAEDSNHIFIEVVYTAGNSDTCEFYLEASNDGGTTYFREVGEAVTAGTITTTLAVHSIAAAQAGNLYIPVPIKGELVRAQVRVTGADIANNSVTVSFNKSALFG